MTRQSHTKYALITVLSLVLAFFFVLRNGYDPRIALLIGCLVGCLVGRTSGCSWADILRGMWASVKEGAEAVVVLALIGALAGACTVSGTIATVIYFGLSVIKVNVFLPASFLICSCTSLILGSWGTIGTIGLGLFGAGTAMGFPAGITAGAIISGAYVGEVISPLSDAVNLVSSVTHVKATVLSTHAIKWVLPVLILCLVLYSALGKNYTYHFDSEFISSILADIDQITSVTPVTMLPIVVILLLLLFQASPLISIAAGIIACGIIGITVQNASSHDVISSLLIAKEVSAANATISQILSSGGVQRIIDSLSLIVIALAFGGMMVQTGQFDALLLPLLQHLKSRPALIAGTVITCALINIILPDQFLSLSLSAKAFEHEYSQRKISRIHLGNIIGFGGATTSCIVPWNTCGIYISGILGVSTLSYCKYCYFSMLMPLSVIIIEFFLHFFQNRIGEKHGV